MSVRKRRDYFHIKHAYSTFNYTVSRGRTITAAWGITVRICSIVESNRFVWLEWIVSSVALFKKSTDDPKEAPPFGWPSSSVPPLRLAALPIPTFRRVIPRQTRPSTSLLSVLLFHFNFIPWRGPPAAFSCSLTTETFILPSTFVTTLLALSYVM